MLYRLNIIARIDVYGTGYRKTEKESEDDIVQKSKIISLLKLECHTILPFLYKYIQSPVWCHKLYINS